MLFVLLTALLLVALLAAKPTEASFSAFWRTRTLTNRLLATFAMDTFEKQWIDLVFIVLVRCVKRRAIDGGDRRRGEGVEAEKWFIGVAGKWFRIPDDYSTLLGSYFAPSTALSENASQARLGDEKEGEADRAKGAGNFARAARLYRERAEMEDESLPFMRGLYYEKAATAGAKSDDGGSVAAWSMAAESFVKAGRMGRAAQCHLAIAQLCRSDEAAFARHKLKAADLFSADNDSYRHMHLLLDAPQMCTKRWATFLPNGCAGPTLPSTIAGCSCCGLPILC